MKYILVIGIEYKFFKKPADITIHIEDKLIDIFRLTRDYPCATNILPQIESKWFERNGRSKWIAREDWIKKWHNVPSLFKVYEIDDSALKGKMQIKVENSNTDYTNGFMKNSSLIKFPIVALFKKDLVENRGEKMMKAIAKLDRGLGKYQKRKGMDYIQTHEPHPGYIRSSWPNADSFWISRENEIHEKNGVRNLWWDIGGSFTAEFMIKTKHHMKVFAPAGSTELGFPACTHPKMFVLATCKQLLNIYDEDQRSNNTKD